MMQKKKLDDLSLTPPPRQPVLDPHTRDLLESLPTGVGRRKDDAPWANLAGLKGKGLNVNLDAELYEQMVWLKTNMPGGSSLVKIVMAGTRAEVKRLLDEHYYK